MAEAAPAPSIRDGERALISEVFHNLSQPLTALQCSLELSLLRDESAEDLRKSVESALENAESLRQRLLLVRALNDADDPGDIQAIVLPEMLRELQQEMLPLFESAGQKFDLAIDSDDVTVRADRAKTMRALFYFLEYLLRYSSPGDRLRMKLSSAGGEARMLITTRSALPLSPGSDKDFGCQQACEVEIARRTFRAAGGDLLLVSSGGDSSVWAATLLLAS